MAGLQPKHTQYLLFVVFTFMFVYTQVCAINSFYLSHSQVWLFIVTSVSLVPTLFTLFFKKYFTMLRFNKNMFINTTVNKPNKHFLCYHLPSYLTTELIFSEACIWNIWFRILEIIRGSVLRIHTKLRVKMLV